MISPTLKPGWEIVKFGDVVHLNTDRVPDPEEAGLERFVGLEHITPDDLRIRSWGLVTEGTTFTNYFKPGQVLFGKRRAYQRKVAVADFEGVCSGDIYVLEPKDPAVLLPELLPFICQTEDFYEHAVRTSDGSLSPRTNWTQLAKHEFLLPSLDEQQRLITLLQSVEQNINHIYLANEAIQRLRSSICVDLLLNTSGTRKKPISNLLSLERTGYWGLDKNKDEVNVRILRSTELSKHGTLDDKGGAIRSIPFSKLEQLRLKTGDILLEKSGGGPNQPVGRVGFVDFESGDELPIICGNFIQLLRPDTAIVHPEWLFWIMFGIHISNQTLKYQTQTTGIRNLQVKNYLSELVPVPPISMQIILSGHIKMVELTRLSLNKRFTKLKILKSNLLSILIHKEI